MIWRRHALHHLAAYVDDALRPDARTRVERHLDGCATCRRALARHRIVAAALAEVAVIGAPPGLWTGIERALDAGAPAAARRQAGRFVLAAATFALVLVGAWWAWTRPDPWDVVRLDQRWPIRLQTGQWIETAATETVPIRIGEIGRVDIEPGSRLQLVSARPTEQRLTLMRGRISVEIVAPPRVFFVETPVSTVVDLGCAYTLEVDDQGYGVLRVTNGWAALEWHDRQSLVPAGASARTHATRGPGTPVFDDAPQAFRDALEAFDARRDVARALTTLLADARERDTLTLWHLLSRVPDGDRVRVVDHMVAFSPLPADVAREDVLALDADALRRWREELAWTW